MGALFRFARRFVSTAPATGADVLTLTLNYASAPTLPTAAFTALRYGKLAALSLVMDDGLTQAREVSADLLSGNPTVNGGKLLRQSDGTGRQMPYRLGLALNAHGNYADNEVNPAVGTTGALGKDDINNLVNNLGWDKYNHGYYHGLTTNGTSSFYSFNGDVNRNVLENHQYQLANYGGISRVIVRPNNDQGYVAAAQAVGAGVYLAGTSTGSENGYPFQGESYKIPVTEESIPTDQLAWMYRKFGDLKIAQDVTDLVAWYTSAMQEEAPGAHPLAIWGMHDCDHNLVMQALDQITTKAADTLWVAGLQEIFEYQELRRLARITSDVVSGTTRTITIDLSGCSAYARRDSFSLITNTGNGAVLQSATVNGSLPITYNPATGLVNVERLRTVTSLSGLARSTAVTPAPTPTPVISSTPTTGPSMALTYDYTLASATSNQNPSGYATLFDQATTVPAPDFATNWLHAGSKMRFPFRPQNLTRLDGIRFYDGAGDAVGAGFQPIAIYYKAVGKTAVQVGSFTGSQYNAVLPDVAIPAGDVAEYVEFWFVDKGAVFPNRVTFIGAQTAYTPPQYDVVAEQIVFSSGVNSDLYDYAELGATGYGAVSETNLTQMRRFGRRNRVYLDVNSMLRPNQYVPQGTGPIERRINAEFHGFLTDDILQRLSAAGDKPFLSVINARARTAATWPGYHQEHPYVAAYTDGNGIAHAEQPAQPWLNGDNTCTPRLYGSDPLNPTSFSQVADDVAQLQLRYGRGTTTDGSKSTFETSKLNTYDTVAPAIKLNLGYVSGFGFLNEQNESYKGIQQLMIPSELTTATSMVFDGAKGAVPGIGVRTVDPNATLTLMPTSFPLPHYFMGIVEQARATRGLKPDGYVDLPFTSADVHYYPTEITTNQNGVPYQVSPSRKDMKLLRQLVREFGGPQMKCGWSESGYVSDSTAIDGVTYLPGRSYIPPSTTYTSPQRVAHWNVQNILCGIADGFDGIQLYAANNISAPGTGKPWDQVGQLKGTPTEFHLGQINPLLDGCVFAGWVQNPDGTLGQASIQRWAKAGQPDTYAVWMPGKAEATGAFALTLPGITSLTKSVPQDTGSVMSTTNSTISGTYSGTATEVPTFYR